MKSIHCMRLFSHHRWSSMLLIDFPQTREMLSSPSERLLNVRWSKLTYENKTVSWATVSERLLSYTNYDNAD